MGVNILLAGIALMWKVGLVFSAGSLDIDYQRTINFCEENHIILGEGADSAVLISLTPNKLGGRCRIAISAPVTHVIDMKVIEIDSPPYKKFRRTFDQRPPCNLTVFQSDVVDRFVWNGNLCDNGDINDVDLLEPELTLIWDPPNDIFSVHQRKLLITSVGKDAVCRSKDQHVCMSIGHNPLFCVDSYLICDGNPNCPKGATKSDEDGPMCGNFNSFNHISSYLKSSKLPENIARRIQMEIYKKKHESDAYRNFVQPVSETATQVPEEAKQTSALESLSMALSHYGPWGYILLGMLICGTVLMVCGVVECLRRPKMPIENLQNTPTTVLIINGQQEESTPPRYDDLDPPSYNTLFPNRKPENNVNNNENVLQNEEVSSNSSENADADSSAESSNESRESRDEISGESTSEITT